MIYERLRRHLLVKFKAIIGKTLQALIVSRNTHCDSKFFFGAMLLSEMLFLNAILRHLPEKNFLFALRGFGEALHNIGPII